METGKSQYLQYIVKHKSIPKLGVKDDNRELANGFGQFLTCNMHMTRYLELTASLKQQMHTLLDTLVQLTEEAIFMVADRESAHFLRLYKTEFTNFLDEYERTVEPAMEADYIAPLTECTSKADRVLAKVEDDHTNALLEYRHYIAKLEKMADEDDTQKLLRTHEKLLNAASRLTSATNNVYEEFNLFDDYRRKLVYDQTPKMFAAQRQLFHELLETMDRMDLAAHPLPPPNHYRPFQVDVPPCPVPVAGRETIGGGGSNLAIDARPSIMARQNSKYARHMRTKSSPGSGVMPLSPIARNRPERAPWDSPEDDQKQPTTTSNKTKTSTVKKAFTLRRPQTASNTESKEQPAPPTAPPTVPPPVPQHRPVPPASGIASAPTTPPRTRPPPPGPPRPTNPQAITPIRTPLASAPPPPRPSTPPPNPLQLPNLPARAPSPPHGPPPPSGRPPRPAPPPPAKQARPPPPAKQAPHPPPPASGERGLPPPLPPRRRSYSEAPPASEQQPTSASASAFARMPPPPPPVRRNSRANDLSERDALTSEVIDAVRAVQQNARRPSFDHS